MNCKQGDLAVIRPTWGRPCEVGAVVHVLRAAIDGEQMVMRDGGTASSEGGGSWLCDSRVTQEFPCFIRDCHLRQIRDSDGEDEMLRIAGRPVGITERV